MSDLLLERGASDGRAFSVSFRGRVIFSHDRARPFLCAGSSSMEYSVSHGMFKMRERNKKLVPVLDWNSRADSDSLVVLESADFGTVRLRAEANRLLVAFEPKRAFTRMRMDIAAGAGESVYGCGEQYSYYNLRGKKVPIWVQEQGIGRGWNAMKFAADIAAHGAGGNKFSTYFAMPVFVSSERYALIADTSAYSEFDFTRRSLTRLEFHEVPKGMTLLFGDSMEALVSMTAKTCGIQPELPDWVYDGIILGAQGGTAESLRKISALEQEGAAVSGLWIQDWEGKRVTSFGSQLFWNWEQSKEMYPDLASTIKDLNKRGIRVLGYINTFLALEGNLYKEASAKGYCIKRPDGSDYLVTITTFPAAMLDLTNPGTIRWIKEIIKNNMIGIGLSGWMADFGEYMPTDAVLHSGENPELAHNKYPALWAEVNHEAIREAGKESEVFFFCRAGYFGSQRHAPSFWAGDQLVNWYKDDGLASIIPAGLSLGLCGVGQYHADIGGYTTVGWVKRSEELLKRWTEAAVFMPVMRSHEGNRPLVNAQPYSNKELAAFTARCSQVYKTLKPYHQALGQEYREQGLPFMRALFTHYPDEAKSWKQPYEYLYGRDLLVAPVVRPRLMRQRVWLPDDEWVHLWTGKQYGGGTYVVDAPFGRPPVFYRKHSSSKALFESFAKNEYKEFA